MEYRPSPSRVYTIFGWMFAVSILKEVLVIYWGWDIELHAGVHWFLAAWRDTPGMVLGEDLLLLLMVALAYGRWNWVWKDLPVRAAPRNRYGCAACGAVILVISLLDAWWFAARGGWWGLAFPVAECALLWVLYRTLYPKNAPEGPEESA